MRGAFAVIAREWVVIAASPLISLLRRQLPPRGEAKNKAPHHGLLTVMRCICLQGFDIRQIGLCGGEDDLVPQ